MAKIDLNTFFKKSKYSPFWEYVDQGSILEIRGKLYDFGELYIFDNCGTGEIQVSVFLNGEDITVIFAILWQILEEDIKWEIYELLEEENDAEAEEEEEDYWEQFAEDNLYFFGSGSPQIWDI